jgi:GT2 family glycosyltransferase
VRHQFPDVHIIQGNGSCFWNGGMRLAWSEALNDSHDFFLWLNDDTVLLPDAMRKMLDTYEEVKKTQDREVIISGSTHDPETSVHTYGGMAVPPLFSPMRFTPLLPQSRPQLCHTINGNCVLISLTVVREIGVLSGKFTHAMGDLDYGLRARKSGFECWITAGYVGTCTAHNISGSFLDRSLPIQERVRRMNPPTGLPPAREWMIFTYHHARFLFPFYWLRTLIRVCCPHLWLLARDLCGNRRG